MRSDPTRILLVEANPQHAQLIQQHLEQTSGATIEVQRAGNLDAASRILSHGKTDALVLDLHLPEGQDGDLVGRVVAQVGRIPVIGLATRPDDDLVSRMIRAAQDVLDKQKLSGNLLWRSVLSGSGARQQPPGR